VIQLFDYDIFGRRKSKKQRQRQTIANNRERGRMGEDLVAMKYTMSGYEVERKHPRGADMTVRKRDPFTGRVTSTRRVEVKTGNAKLSKIQKRVKKKKRTTVERVDSPFF
jgi:hypothetical protein